MNAYESMILFDPNLEDAKVDESVDKILAAITKDGGEVVNVDKWGKRSLSYEIKKFSRAYYVLLNFKVKPENIKTIDRLYRLNESVIRYLTINQEAMPIPDAPQEDSQY